MASANSIDSIDQALDTVSHASNRVVGIATGDDLVQQNILGTEKTVREQLQTELGRVRYLYKDRTYHFEKECRLVETPESAAEKGMRTDFDYSGTQGMAVVKKYINHPSLKLTADVLRSGTRITLGPQVANPVHAKEYIKRLLEDAGFYGPEVLISEIPYRTSFHY